MLKPCTDNLTPGISPLVFRLIKRLESDRQQAYNDRAAAAQHPDVPVERWCWNRLKARGYVICYDIYDILIWFY